MALSIAEILARLETTFTVRDIMVRIEDMTRASSETESQELLSLHPGYDVIPIVTNSRVTSYVVRGEASPKKKAVSPTDLIADGTPITQLPTLMDKESRYFFFVLCASDVVGFVDFSDMNKNLVKLPYYILLEAVERHLWEPATRQLTPELLVLALKEKRAGEIMSKKEGKQKEDIDTGWEGILYLSDIIHLVRYQHKDIKVLKKVDELLEVRNRVAHNDKDLVSKRADIHTLVRAWKTCNAILDTPFPKGDSLT